MSYEQITINELINGVNERRYLLPAIQRKFVWKESQIVNLFDSILRDYPIGTFLFWQLDKEEANSGKYMFYDFIKHYHERDKYLNEQTGKVTAEKVIAVLDGQQRMSSLFIALVGSLSMKLPKAWWSNDNAFQKKELYLNLLKDISLLSDEEETLYEFKFLTIEESKESEKIWFKIKDILDVKRIDDIDEFADNNGWGKLEKKNLRRLWISISFNKAINFYQVTNNSMDEVLDIFVRVNSGGTILSKTDLLFSSIVSSWQQAREEIESLIITNNKKGNRFNFNTDFVMRTSLYLMDLPIALKVDSFKNSNLDSIKINWNKIKSAFNCTFDFLAEYGFCDENIVSYNAIIPIVYFIYKDGDLDNSKNELMKYFIVAQIKQLFGVASSSALTSTRDALRVSKENLSLKNKKFTFELFKKIKLTGDRTFVFGKEQLEIIFEDYEKNAYTFMILSLLQPELRLGDIRFHQDHLHPYSAFDKKKLEELEVENELIKKWQKNRNKLPNLQLLEEKKNKSKNASTLEEWLKDNEAKYMPKNISVDIRHFDTFYEARKILMWNQLCEIFGLDEEKLHVLKNS